jgi:hypothetical protein
VTTVESYLGAFSAALRVPARERRRIVAEVRDHLVDDMAAGERAGATPEAAAADALEAFGPPVDIARRFNALAGTRDARRATIALGTSGAIVAAGFLFGAAQQAGARSVAAPLWLPVLFFAARVAFEIALVSGLCAAAHALAFGPAVVASSRDRGAVRRAVNAGTAALCLSAIGLVATLFAALDRYGVSDASRLVAGAVVVAIAIPIATITQRRFKGNDDDDDGDSDAPPSGAFMVGERSLAVVRRHPVMACGVVATASMITAMSSAESTVPVAFGWGIAQAACVITGFLWFGPGLGLRRDAEHTAPR